MTLPSINDGFISDYPIECYGHGQYSIECLYKTICPQLNSHIINFGIGIIIIWVLLSWFLWWYFNFGYKKFMINNSFVGNMEFIETRIYWDTWIRARVMTLCIGYIALVVWLSINFKI